MPSVAFRREAHVKRPLQGTERHGGTFPTTPAALEYSKWLSSYIFFEIRHLPSVDPCAQQKAGHP